MLSQIGDVDQALNAVLNADEGAEGDELGDLTGHHLTNGVGAGEGLPRVLLGGLQRQGDAFTVEVNIQDLNGDFLAHFDDLGGVVDVLPGQLGDMHQAVHAAPGPRRRRS